jgi:hypothetical protein
VWPYNKEEREIAYSFQKAKKKEKKSYIAKKRDTK